MRILPLLISAREHSTVEAHRGQRLAIGLSLVTGFLMLAGKMYAYLITGSSAILSDAAESVVHVFAVAFAAFSLWLTQRPADRSHPYGHEKISFFSAGMEGGLIIVAAAFIIYTAIEKWIAGISIQNLEAGTAFVAGAVVINLLLGGYLVWKGKRTGSLILIGNGQHVLTGVWTSAAVVVGLLLTQWTGVLQLDPIIAILAALNILWSGGGLIRSSVAGLMDEGDQEIEAMLEKALHEETEPRGLRFHEMRYRIAGSTLLVEAHLLFPGRMLLSTAHSTASEIEAGVARRVPVALRLVTHLEPMEKHDESHLKTGVPPA